MKPVFTLLLLFAAFYGHCAGRLSSETQAFLERQRALRSITMSGMLTVTPPVHHPTTIETLRKQRDDQITIYKVRFKDPEALQKRISTITKSYDDQIKAAPTTSTFEWYQDIGDEVLIKDLSQGADRVPTITRLNEDFADFGSDIRDAKRHPVVQRTRHLNHLFYTHAPWHMELDRLLQSYNRADESVSGTTITIRMQDRKDLTSTFPDAEEIEYSFDSNALLPVPSRIIMKSQGQITQVLNLEQKNGKIESLSLASMRPQAKTDLLGNFAVEKFQGGAELDVSSLFSWASNATINDHTRWEGGIISYKADQTEAEIRRLIDSYNPSKVRGASVYRESEQQRTSPRVGAHRQAVAGEHIVTATLSLPSLPHADPLPLRLPAIPTDTTSTVLLTFQNSSGSTVTIDQWEFSCCGTFLDTTTKLQLGPNSSSDRTFFLYPRGFARQLESYLLALDEANSPLFTVDISAELLPRFHLSAPELHVPSPELERGKVSHLDLVLSAGLHGVKSIEFRAPDPWHKFATFKHLESMAPLTTASCTVEINYLPLEAALVDYHVLIDGQPHSKFSLNFAQPVHVRADVSGAVVPFDSEEITLCTVDSAPGERTLIPTLEQGGGRLATRRVSETRTIIELKDSDKLSDPFASVVIERPGYLPYMFVAYDARKEALGSRE